jgi:hypothetical protein
VPTWSAHWLADPTFARAVADYLAREQETMQEYMQELTQHLPFKRSE